MLSLDKSFFFTSKKKKIKSFFHFQYKFILFNLRKLFLKNPKYTLKMSSISTILFFNHPTIFK